MSLISYIFPLEKCISSSWRIPPDGDPSYGLPDTRERSFRRHGFPCLQTNQQKQNQTRRNREGYDFWWNYTWARPTSEWNAFKTLHHHCCCCHHRAATTSLAIIYLDVPLLERNCGFLLNFLFYLHWFMSVGNFNWSSRRFLFSLHVGAASHITTSAVLEIVGPNLSPISVFSILAWVLPVRGEEAKEDRKNSSIMQAVFRFASSGLWP